MIKGRHCSRAVQSLRRLFSEFDPKATIERTRNLDPAESNYHYKILGVEPGATEEELKSKFIIISKE